MLAAADNDQDKDQVKALTLLLAAYLKGADSPGHFLRSTVTFERNMATLFYKIGKPKRKRKWHKEFLVRSI